MRVGVERDCRSHARIIASLTTHQGITAVEAAGPVELAADVPADLLARTTPDALIGALGLLDASLAQAGGLHERDGGDHEQAARDLGHLEELPEEDPAGEGADDRLERRGQADPRGRK